MVVVGVGQVYWGSEKEDPEATRAKLKSLIPRSRGATDYAPRKVGDW